MDEYRLDDLAAHHGVNVGIFVPFAVHRLEALSQGNEAALTVKLRNIPAAGEVQRRLRLTWSNEATQLTAITEQTITEWAALGVAAAIVAKYTGLRITSVSAAGDGFDYWLADGQQDIALEVSGTQTADVEARHRAKVRQWQANPHGIDGYIAIIGFGTREAILSFHRFAEVSR